MRTLALTLALLTSGCDFFDSRPVDGGPLPDAGPRRGAGCEEDTDCELGLTCRLLDPASDARVCMTICDPAHRRLCATGEVCARMPVDAPTGACFPGGTTATGANCTSSFECVAGAICVNRADLGTTRCYKACDTSRHGYLDFCATDETCVQLTAESGTDGYCDSAP